MSNPARKLELLAALDELKARKASVEQLGSTVDAEEADHEHKRALYQQKKAELFEVEGYRQYRMAVRSGNVPQEGSWGPGSDQELNERMNGLTADIMAMMVELSFKGLRLQEASREVASLKSITNRLKRVVENKPSA